MTEEADSGVAFMLDVILMDGTVESFDYAMPKRAIYKPDGTLLLQFGEDGVRIQGRNLEPLRLAVTECRLRAIRQHNQAEADLLPDDATFIESIEVRRLDTIDW